MCTYYFSDISKPEIGKEYVFALHKYLNSFSPPACAVWYLEVENNKVKGKITSDIESIAYNKLNSLENCGN